MRYWGELKRLRGQSVGEVDQRRPTTIVKKLAAPLPKELL